MVHDLLQVVLAPPVLAEPHELGLVAQFGGRALAEDDPLLLGGKLLDQLLLAERLLDLGVLAGDVVDAVGQT